MKKILKILFVLVGIIIILGAIFFIIDYNRVRKLENPILGINNIIKEESSFYGKVIESNRTTIIVEPNEDEAIRKSSDKIAIGLGEHNDALFVVGTNVKITNEYKNKEM